jgi:hypothetical protein
VSLDDLAGRPVVAGLCPPTRREIRRTIRDTVRVLRRGAGLRLATVITCRVYDDPDEIRRVLAACYADPTPGELALLDQFHAHLDRHQRRCVLVLAHGPAGDEDGSRW